MKSSLIEFIERYRDIKMSHEKLAQLWKKKIDKTDFDHNEQEVFRWFKNYQKLCQTSLIL